MKKLNIVFTSLIAILLFFMSWHTFNLNYFTKQTAINGNALKSENTEAFELFISTHVLDVEVEIIKDTIVQFYERNGYEGYVSFFVVEDDLSTLNNYYLFMDYDDGLFEFFTIPEKIDIDFQSKTEKSFITNDLSKDAYYIDYLDTNYYDIRDDYDRSNFNIHPIYQLYDLDDATMRNMPINMIIYGPANESEIIKQLIFEEIYHPLGLDINESTESLMFESISNETQNIINFIDENPLTGFDWGENMTEMPKPLLLIAAVALLLINIYLIFAHAKEIYVRKMHGNSDVKIFIKTTLSTVLGTLITFILTYVIIWMIYIRSFRSVALLFTRQLFDISVVYTLFVLIVGIILYIYLYLKNSVLLLKKKLDMSLTLILTTTIKVVSVFLLIVPLVTNFKSWRNHEAGLRAMENDPVYLKSVGLQGISQPFYPASVDPQIHTKVADWYERIHKETVELIETQNLSFVDMDEYHFSYAFEDSTEVYPYAIINKTHLSYYPITKDNHLFDFSSENHNFIVVPNKYREDFDITNVQVDAFEAMSIYYVDHTFTQFSNYPGHNNQYQDPILYVIVDDYSGVSSFYNNLRKVIETDDDLTSFNRAMFEFNQNSAQFPRIDSKDIYELMLDNVNKERTEFYIMFMISIFVITLFTYLSTHSFIEIFRKEFAIKYIHGYGNFKRYGLIYAIYGIAIVVLRYLLERYNDTLLMTGREYLVIGTYYIWTTLSVTLLVDIAVSSYVIYKFHRNNVATLLKGAGDS